jgi:NAD(P)-dependent dehydrogenase (short-subunit alcohol dehydrogenase family)
MLRLNDKIAIVTGAARGLGRSHALALAREGAHVAVVDVCRTIGASAYNLAARADLEDVASRVEALGRQTMPITCDVRNNHEVQDMVHQVIQRWGRVDVLVNNAGVISLSPVMEMKESAWDLVVDVNLKGTFLCSKHVVIHMMRQRSGRIINTGSIAGREGIPLNAHYGAAKAGVHVFTQALAKEVAPYGVNVNAVAPGGVNTPMMQGISSALARLWGIGPEEAYQAFCQRFHTSGRAITEQDVSTVVVWLASEEARNLTGQIVYIQ